MNTLNNNSLKIGFHCLMIQTKSNTSMSAEKYRQQLDLVKQARSKDGKKSVEQYNASKWFDMLKDYCTLIECFPRYNPCRWFCVINVCSRALKREWTNVKHTKTSKWTIQGIYKGISPPMRSYIPESKKFPSIKGMVVLTRWWHIYYSHDQQIESTK